MKKQCFFQPCYTHSHLEYSLSPVPPLSRIMLYPEKIRKTGRGIPSNSIMRYAKN